MLQIFISCHAIFRFSIKRLSLLLRFGILQWEPNPAWVQRALQFMRPDVTAHCPFFRTHDTFADRRIYADEDLTCTATDVAQSIPNTEQMRAKSLYSFVWFTELDEASFLCLLSSRCKIWEENSPDKEIERYFRGRNLFLLGLYCIRVTVLDFHDTVRVVKWFVIMIISQCVKKKS